MELAAYEEGNRDLLLQLVLMDKWTTSAEQANALIDEIFALTYHEDLRQHYRWVRTPAYTAALAFPIRSGER